MEITAEAIESATVIGPNGAFTKICEWCCRPLVRREGEEPWNFKKRRCCCEDCRHKLQAATLRGKPNKRTVKSSAPGGYGSVRSSGYRMMHNTETGKSEFEHRMVWEAANGPVPDGYEIHHRDGNKLNNSLENLQLLTTREHHQIHAGYLEIDGRLTRPCRRCGTRKDVSEFSISHGHVCSWCKKCCVEYERERRARHASA